MGHATGTRSSQSNGFRRRLARRPASSNGRYPSDINILKTIGVFCGTGLPASLVLASYGWDLGSSLFQAHFRRHDVPACFRQV
jgi:hypothetical protein